MILPYFSIFSNRFLNLLRVNSTLSLKRIYHTNEAGGTLRQSKMHAETEQAARWDKARCTLRRPGHFTVIMLIVRWTAALLTAPSEWERIFNNELLMVSVKEYWWIAVYRYILIQERTPFAAFPAAGSPSTGIYSYRKENRNAGKRAKAQKTAQQSDKKRCRVYLRSLKVRANKKIIEKPLK